MKLAIIEFALVLVLMLVMALPAAASGAVFGVVNSTDGTIELHNTKGICAGDALSATYRPEKHGGENVAGCWIAKSGFVLVVFMDADVATVPIGAVRKPEEA